MLELTLGQEFILFFLVILNFILNNIEFILQALDIRFKFLGMLYKHILSVRYAGISH